MLRIHYGEYPGAIRCGYHWLEHQGELEWLTTDLSKEMIRDIDKSEVISAHLIESPILGPIPPAYLSGGVRVLVCVAHAPADKVFNVTSCGENCAKWLLEIARRSDRDILVTIDYLTNFGNGPFEIEIENSGKIAHNDCEFVKYSIEVMD